MLAVFGAPRPLDNHAERAVEAGKAILHKIEHFSPLPIGIGLHSGTIVAGCLGVAGHLEFTVIGDTVNVAARLEAMTKQVEYSLLLSATTKYYLQQQRLTSLGEMPVQGRDAPIVVFGVS